MWYSAGRGLLQLEFTASLDRIFFSCASFNLVLLYKCSVACVYRVYEVHSRVQSCPGPPHSLTLTHMQSTASPASSIHVSALYRCAIFYLLYIFLVYFFCLDMFTQKHHYVTQKPPPDGSVG